MKIEKATGRDLEAVNGLFETAIDALDPLYRADWQKNIYPNRHLLKELIDAGEIYAAKENGKILAVIVLNEKHNPSYSQAGWKDLEKDEYLVIHLLCVDPEYRSRGIASEMIRFAKEEALRQNRKALRLDVYSRNIPAARFYLKQGFSHRGSIRQQYEEQNHWKMSNVFELYLKPERKE